MKSVNIYERHTVSAIRIFEHLLEGEMCTFYRVDELLLDFEILEQILSYFDLGDLADAIDCCYNLYKSKEGFISICQRVIEEAIKLYCSDVNAEEFDINVQEFVENSYDVLYCGDGEYYNEPDADEATNQIISVIKEMVKDELLNYLNNLPDELSMSDSFLDEIYIDVSGAGDLVESYLKSDYYDKDQYRGASQSNYSEIDLIFNR